ncbi:MAG: type III-A CRISPR-associated RAMP protein Csm3 [Nitrososphaerota archaeon]|nr:type III-A CRISPR-associated RAMP protein Csm3 [Candidatus Verstraetearchaeota archaeon]
MTQTGVEGTSVDLKLIKNIVMVGKIKTLTGLHIGGNKGELKIGGTDNPVITDPQGRPYIPGSTLKGKLRSLLEFSLNRVDPSGGVHSCGDEDCPICVIFGSPGEDRVRGPTRLIVRDATLVNDVDTEIKMENVINRLKGSAEHPRAMERVPPGAEFAFEMVYGIYNQRDYEMLRYVFSMLSCLEDSYLGGSGSRGYGKVKVEDVSLIVKTVEDYYNGREGEKIVLNGKEKHTPLELVENFESVLKEIGK